MILSGAKKTPPNSNLNPIVIQVDMDFEPEPYLNATQIREQKLKLLNEALNQKIQVNTYLCIISGSPAEYPGGVQKEPVCIRTTPE